MHSQEKSGPATATGRAGYGIHVLEVAYRRPGFMKGLSLVLKGSSREESVVRLLRKVQIFSDDRIAEILKEIGNGE